MVVRVPIDGMRYGLDDVRGYSFSVGFLRAVLRGYYNGCRVSSVNPLLGALGTLHVFGYAKGEMVIGDTVQPSSV